MAGNESLTGEQGYPMVTDSGCGRAVDGNMR